MDDATPSQPGIHLGLVAPIAAVAFVFVLCLFFAPRWETNDDIAMSMVAQGYGIAATGMPNLIFSNVLWGHLVRLVPEINGVPGYSIATLVALVAVGVVVVYGIGRSGFGHIASVSALALILARPVLFPQFTINAGLLMVAAILCWHLYARGNDNRALMAGCLLALSSYLVRGPEFLLVLIVGLPLLPVRAFLLRKPARVALAALVAAIALAAFIDRQAYQGAAWTEFNDLNPIRAEFTDFGLGVQLKQRPDILERHAYTLNDIDLMQNWFFVDPVVANPEVLKEMANELGLLPARGRAFINAWYSVQTFWHPSLLILVLAALALAALRPTWQVAASWSLCVAAIIALGLLGRPGVVRVYVPLVCLLLVAPFLGGRFPAWRRHLATAVLLLAAAVNTFTVVSESRRVQIADKQLRQELAGFPGDPVVVWGSDFPFEAAYPMLGASSAAMSYRLYALGVFSLAPFAVAFAEEESGRGLIDRLVSESGLPVIADEIRLGYLDTYCKERLHGEAKELSVQQHGQFRVSRRRCEVAP